MSLKADRSMAVKPVPVRTIRLAQTKKKAAHIPLLKRGWAKRVSPLMAMRYTGSSSIAGAAVEVESFCKMAEMTKEG